MKNIEMIQMVYTDLTETLYDLGEELLEVKSNKYLGDTLNDMDKISVILKRLGETAVIEIDEEPIEGQEQIDGKEE
jgi:hypothetical protein